MRNDRSDDTVVVTSTVASGVHVDGFFAGANANFSANDRTTEPGVTRPDPASTRNTRTIKHLRAANPHIGWLGWLRSRSAL